MIYIASDHAGFQLKKYLETYLTTQLKQEISDLGPKKYEETDDYTDYAPLVGKAVARNPKSLGILICGSGHGMCIAANKIKGVRASIGYSIEGTELARRDDDVNILCLAGKIISEDHAAAIVKKFLETELRTDSNRYSRRLEKIKEIEESN